MSNNSNDAHANRDAERGGPNHKMKPAVWFLMFPFVVVVTVLSFAAPYWYCRWYSSGRVPGKEGRRKNGDQRQRLTTSNDIPQDVEIVWKRILQRVQRQWKIYHILALIVVPTALKAYVVPAPERCSLTYFLATVALLGTMMQLAATTILREYRDALQKYIVVENWLEASDDKWYSQSSVLFWIFLSTPAVWFSISVVASILSIILSVWTEGQGESACLYPSDHSYLLRATVSVIALTSLINVGFIISTLQSFDLNDPNERN